MKNNRMIERIIIIGFSNGPTTISTPSGLIEFEHDPIAKVLVLRKPGVSALSDWEIKIQ